VTFFKSEGRNEITGVSLKRNGRESLSDSPSESTQSSEPPEVRLYETPQEPIKLIAVSPGFREGLDIFWKP
jgi:hypothetical protein